MELELNNETTVSAGAVAELADVLMKTDQKTKRTQIICFVCGALFFLAGIMLKATGGSVLVLIEAIVVALAFVGVGICAVKPMLISNLQKDVDKNNKQHITYAIDLDYTHVKYGTEQKDLYYGQLDKQYFESVSYLFFKEGKGFLYMDKSGFGDGELTLFRKLLVDKGFYCLK